MTYLHVVGAPYLDQVDIKKADEYGRNRTGHQEPAVHSTFGSKIEFVESMTSF
jgi:hypothetical protein